MRQLYICETTKAKNHYLYNFQKRPNGLTTQRQPTTSSITTQNLTLYKITNISNSHACPASGARCCL